MISILLFVTDPSCFVSEVKILLDLPVFCIPLLMLLLFLNVSRIWPQFLFLISSPYFFSYSFSDCFAEFHILSFISVVVIDFHVFFWPLT